MTKAHIKRIRLVYGILLSAVIIAAGICLMAACIDIYRSGDHAYSREAVAAHFVPISALVYLCIAMVIGGFLLDMFLPIDQGKTAAGKQDALILKRLHEKNDLDQCDETLRAAIMAQQEHRNRCNNFCAVLMTVCAMIFLAYALNSSHFLMTDINASMVRAMGILLPCLAIAFGCAVFNVYFSRASIRKEIDLMKQLPAAGKSDSAKFTDKKTGKAKRTGLRYAILIVGIGLLLYGFLTGGTADVLTKAINICTECVGLG